jgi:SAM-dependent methyltransferase
MNPGPSEQVVSDLYRKSRVYKFWSEEVYPSTRLTRESNLVKPRLTLIQKVLEQVSPEKIVEVGSGTGDLLLAIKSSYPTSTVTGIEPNPDMWKSYSDDRIFLVREGYQQALPRMAELDLVCAFEVLEHLLNPSEFFSQARKCLKTGGKLLCSTPNAASVEIQFTKNESNTVDVEHISLLTPSAVHSLANRYGFAVDFIETPGQFDLELISKIHPLLNFAKRFLPSVSSRVQAGLSSFGFSSHMKFCLSKL